MLMVVFSFGLRGTKFHEGYEYFLKTYSDSDRSFKYSPPPNLPTPPLRTVAFDTSAPSFADFSRRCWKKSSGSAPGMNGIPYLVYKMCPGLRRMLWEICCRVWRERRIPVSWQIARVRLIAKSQDISHPSLMRPISVLNAEGRLFFTVYERRLSSYLLANGYIQRKVQKTFLEEKWQGVLSTPHSL